ncbi:MAG: hypothetical protein ACRDT9_00085 [Agromyces sp.]
MKAAFGTPNPETVAAPERVNHVAEALRNISPSAVTHYNNVPGQGTPEYVPGSLEIAQVHATLALVEQQRLANLIALSAACDPDGDPATRLDDLRMGLAGEVWEGLGLA